MKKTWMSFLVLSLLISIIVPVSLAFAATSKEVDVPTLAELQQKYATGTEKVRILIVPGHEPQFGGAQYQGIYEREMTVEAANELAAYLRQNPRLEVIVARTNSEWHEDLEEYFEEEWEEIEDFVKDQKRLFTRLTRRGDFEKRGEGEQVDHAAAPSDVALRLYGINAWANDNDVDLAIHLHFNDAPDHGADAPSAHSGYAVYVPDHQYENADTSKPIAEAIAARLSAMNATSTLPVEDAGVVEDQELIALGAYGTLNVPSVLLEYAYVTEPRFQHPEIRQTVVRDYAYETYLGVQDALKDPVVTKFPTASLPFTFASSSLPAMGSSSPAVYALQAGLHTLGLYPVHASTTPANARIAPVTLTMCPIDGVMGQCTVNGIEAFQIAKGWATTGKLGPQTLAALNAALSSQPVVAVLPAATTTPGTCAVPASDLSAGAVGKDVSTLQTLLSTDPAVYPQKLVTGTFGPATEAAVQKFQETYGVAKKGEVGYGFVGPKTKAALSATYCK